MPAIIRINLETGSVSRREQEKDDLLLGGQTADRLDHRRRSAA